jgi:anti-sigma B factor antagonist
MAAPYAMASVPRILAIEGELDLNNVPVVREQLASAVASKTQRVLLDLSGLSYIDSSGLALFIESLQRIQAYGGKLALFGLRDSVRSIFEIARLDQVFQLFPDKDTALTA